VIDIPDGKAGIKAVTEEMFNPLLSLQTYQDLDEAIQKANQPEFALRASFWTAEDNHEVTDKMVRELIAGGIMANSPHIELPYGSSDLGGHKKSSDNISYEGAKLMPLEFTFGKKFMTFQTPEQADHFIRTYWDRTGK